MSAYMVPNETRTALAKYLANCADNGLLKDPAFTDLRLSEPFRTWLRAKGCVVEDMGLFGAAEIHRLLTEQNHAALVERYGAELAAQMGSPDEPMAEGVAIDRSIENRKAWLASLYTVARCYLYQIQEGDWRANPLCAELQGWIGQLAAALAAYAVEEVRGAAGAKSWSRF